LSDPVHTPRQNAANGCSELEQAGVTGA